MQNKAETLPGTQSSSYDLLIICQIKNNLSDGWKDKILYLKHSINKNINKSPTTIPFDILKLCRGQCLFCWMGCYAPDPLKCLELHVML